MNSISKKILMIQLTLMMKSKKNIMNKKRILGILLIIILIALGVFLFNKERNNTDTGFLPKEEAVNKALEYINKYVLRGQQEAALVQIYEPESENTPYYKFQISLAGQQYDSVVTADGSRLFTNGGEDLNAEQDELAEGSFLKRETDVITEDGKPVIYLFTSSTCPHCGWEKPVLQSVIDQFGDTVIYKNRENSTEDQDIYSSYGNGGVPLVVLGGVYYREGAGEQLGEEKEKEFLTKYICELTGNQPETVCQ